MKKPTSYGFAENKEAAKELRRELNKLPNRKGHYTKLVNSEGYHVWTEITDWEAEKKRVVDGDRNE